MMTAFKISLRKDTKTGEALLFFVDESGQLVCYAHVGQHSVASREYMRRDTIPSNIHSAAHAALLEEWQGQGGYTEVKIVKRLGASA
jgi:hypothetical protein